MHMCIYSQCRGGAVGVCSNQGASQGQRKAVSALHIRSQNNPQYQPANMRDAAEEVQSVLAASGAPLVERYTHQHSMLMLEAALEKARRAHRPLIITSLKGPSDDPSQIHMDPSLLTALDMQV